MSNLMKLKNKLIKYSTKRFTPLQDASIEIIKRVPNENNYAFFTHDHADIAIRITDDSYQKYGMSDVVISYDKSTKMYRLTGMNCWWAETIEEALVSIIAKWQVCRSNKINEQYK